MAKQKIHKIVVAFDSFKGSISSREANECCANAIHEILPDCEVVQVPVADGGEGFDIIAEQNPDFRKVSIEVYNPLMKKITSQYFLNAKTGTAIIEMAQACGLTLLSQSEQNPEKTSSFGLGEMIVDAMNKGAVNIIVGIGGSATNDGGMGMLNALGFRFLDFYGAELKPSGENLSNIHSIDFSNIHLNISKTSFTIACDVTNPLLGENGATFIYGAQKGGNNAMLNRLESGMSNYADILSNTKRRYLKHQSNEELNNNDDWIKTPGAGAAGGVGAAFLWLGNSTLKHGIDIVLDIQNFNDAIIDADIIITGEGSIDNQTLNGKAISGIINRANKKNIPVIGVGGMIDYTNKLSNIDNLAIFSIINSPSTLSECINHNTAINNLNYTIKEIIKLIDITK